MDTHKIKQITTSFSITTQIGITRLDKQEHVVNDEQIKFVSEIKIISTSNITLLYITSNRVQLPLE